MTQSLIVDIDGIIFDAFEAHAKSWVKACRSFKSEIPIVRVRRIIGMSSEQIAQSLIGAEPGTPQNQQLTERKDQIFARDHLSTIRIFPGARELINRLKQDGLTVITASYSNGTILMEMLKRAQLQNLVSIESEPISSHYFERLKNPQLNTANAQVSSRILIGGSPYIIDMALKAEIPSIALLCGGWSPEALNKASAIYRDPADLISRFSNFAFKQLIKQENRLPRKFPDATFPL